MKYTRLFCSHGSDRQQRSVFCQLTRAASLLALVFLVEACGAGLRPFPLAEPMWRDLDRRPFNPEPEEYYSPFAWDAADQTLFRPFARFWAVDPGGEAVNVNAWDEVPDSSWFANRIGRFGMSTAELVKGPCNTPALDPQGPWTVTRAKPNGANPGFIITDNVDRKYMIKFDGVVQGPRATAADTIGSYIYYAAGFHTPCNRIVFFNRKILSISPDAKSDNEDGEKVPMTEKDLDKIFAKAIQLPDGRYRASSSLLLKGKPIGPFRYEGTRSDDPNDVIDHDDRRELRGARLLAAWTNHFDSREQNTLDMYITVEGKGGYVKHNIIDFGDCFGSIWEPPMLGRRIGYAYYLDLGELFADFFTFGIRTRPWDKARFGATKRVFGYYNVELFVPEEWKPGYPNPAMGRMTELDGAWMARIIARFTDEHVRALVANGKIQNELIENELIRILIGRRDKILRRYLTRLSPLTEPQVRKTASTAELCLNDLAVRSGVFAPQQRRYSARGWLTKGLHPVAMTAPRAVAFGQVCVPLPQVARASAEQPRYVIVDVFARSGSEQRTPVRVHLYHLGGADYRVVGLQRPDDVDPPG